MLLLVCILFLAYNVRNAYSRQQEEKEMHAQEQAFGISDIIRLALEAVVIYIGASMLVEVGPKLARAFGVPEMIISLIFVALGTSLPELVTSLMALRKKHASLSMGNIIGADILNFVMVGGAVGGHLPDPVSREYFEIRTAGYLFHAVSTVHSIHYQEEGWQAAGAPSAGKLYPVSGSSGGIRWFFLGKK